MILMDLAITSPYCVFMSGRQERRLAAIIVADVVGYSRLIGIDEAGTIQAIRALQRDIIEPLLLEYGGRMVKTMGDGFLIEFRSVVAGVEAATEIQKRLGDLFARKPSDKPIQMRIGIHVGDIVIEGADIFGEGVNIAARIEPLAKPGGVGISDDAYRQVRDRTDIKWDDGGEHEVKNIARPIRIWHWSHEPIPAQAETFTPPPLPELSEAQSLATRGEWLAAFNLMSNLDARDMLDRDALEEFGVAAYMIGREADFTNILERAFEAHCEAGDPQRAARAAFWIGLTLMFRGETALGAGWLARSKRQLEEAGIDSAEQGLLLCMRVEQLIGAGDLDAAAKIAAEAVSIGERFDDSDLVAMARHCLGRILLDRGHVPEGLALLDEVMLAVVGDTLSPIVTGLLYCSVIAACQRYLIQKRAKQWTDALSGWCGRQSELVAFTGRCLIHRSEILIFDGNWDGAAIEAQNAAQRLLAGPIEHQAGPAFYQEGEVHRLRGEFAKAEAAYKTASGLGFDPQPGLALIRLEQGQATAASASIERALASAGENSVGLLRLLPAAVEIMLGSNRVDQAREYCDRLSSLAERFSSEVVEAEVADAQGNLLYAEGQVEPALAELTRASSLWRELGAPYRHARSRIAIGRCCVTVGDHDGTSHEINAAIDILERLGASPDANRARQIIAAPAAKDRRLRKTPDKEEK